MVGVLFVCTGNICRSPTAEGVFRSLVRDAGLEQRVQVDSAGTQGWHEGGSPDPRSQAAAAGRGIELGDLRARKVRVEDFTQFDYLVAMDDGHRDSLLSMAPLGAHDRVCMMLQFAPQRWETEVPDPYYGGADGFEQVLDLIETSSAGLLDHIRQIHNL